MFHCFFILLKVFYVISNESGGDRMFGFPNRSQGPTGPTRTPKVFEIRQAVKNNNRTEVLLPERPVPRCHGARCVGAESSLGPPPNGCEVVWDKACTALQMPNGFTPSDSYAT